MRVRNWTNPSPPRLDQIDLAQPIDWSSPSAKGLRFWVPGWLARSPGMARDYAGRRPVTPDGVSVINDETMGRCLDFDGYTDRLDYPNIKLAAGPQTVSMWLKRATTSGYTRYTWCQTRTATRTTAISSVSPRRADIPPISTMVQQAWSARPTRLFRRDAGPW